MQAPPADWLSLLLLTFVLGMKHGFDADHLATIDGLTRHNSRVRPALARYCGTLFSLGHGAVVMAIALGVSAAAGQWAVPQWFGTLGALISIGFLAALGMLNLAAVLRAGPDQVVQPVGIKGRLLGSLRHVSNPLAVALVGALFALSFDTLSQAAFFALAATQFGGWQHALVLALLFMLGMLLTDGINGLWIARLIVPRRPDRAHRLARHGAGGGWRQPAGGGLWRGQAAAAGRGCMERGPGTAVWCCAGGRHCPELPGCDAAGAAPSGRCLKTLSRRSRILLFL
jgi:high-affinity nickel-transport protein